jgi:small subunit ribosomal protein S6
MNRYEAMFIVKPELSEDERKVLFNQLHEAVTKNHGTVSQGAVWSERRKLYFPMKKHREGVYYLMNFSLNGPAIKDINHIYTLNENILRVLISKLE